ncbi:MAG: hypothetical protein F4123_04835 [Gemmatimonadetes bacterium]|nr:hypothetical protein [Gemmatimonadota bacterium]MYB98826.1 hypothetical protein [Gemmatimonadota bacterium]MYI45692.1 hypothetical protein [Gemmatimonadota bacterium]
MITAHFPISNAVLRAAGATLAAGAVIAIAAADLSAQRRGPALRAASGTTAVEMSLRLAERLELTQEQRDQLESIRVSMLEQRAGHTVRMMSLASEVRAGIRERSAIREEFAAIRGEAEEQRKSFREQYDGILTDEQKQELRQVTRRAAWRRGAVRGRAGMDRWRGTRGRPAVDRGRGVGGRAGIDRGRGWHGRPGLDRSRGGERTRGWRRPDGAGS